MAGAIRAAVKQSAKPPTFGGPDSQMWMGSVPEGISQPTAIQEVVDNGLPRPTKMLLRGGRNENGKYAICYFRNLQEGRDALQNTVVWNNGETAEIKP